ncbi:amino acid adenylation domain-containing protein [Micromonospora sp. B11E3]|uniref:non-ribosomal peptide synthetase/type I polyketide synthase n=1 Tax=Micromonospora sp. B11E3 TaxID=3153562 RepID=UPI00325F4860
MERWIVRRVAEQLGLPSDAVTPDAVLADLGMSSRDALSLVGDLEALLGRTLSPTIFWNHPTARALSRHLVGPAADGNGEPVPGGTATGRADEADGPGEPAPGDVATGRAAGSRRPRRGEAAAAGHDGPADQAVAVIGLSCRFPGAEGPEEFWRLLDEGRPAGESTPAGRQALGPVPQRLLDTVDLFDPAFFGISAAEAAYLDPQQRLLLEVAWEAIESAGVPPADLAGSRTGVFVGISGSDYGRLQTSDNGLLGRHSATGQALSIAANRLSYVLDLHGPSLAVDTACSSSLTAVHLACRSLRAGECTTALAGGVNLVLASEATEIFTAAGMMAPDGRCKTFDASADGYVRAEGCGLVLLKPLAAALRDGDPVLAVIRGSAINQDGRSNGLTAPSGTAQQAVLRDALRDAGVAPADVDYVEAHGTGTPLGDPIETGALSAVLSEGREPDAPFLLGSVKTNIGHTEAAAGVAGLIKVILMLRHRRVPAHLHLRRRNPEIAADGGFEIPTGSRPWRRRRERLTAGVSSFGFGGTNAHVVVQEAPQPAPRAAAAADAPARVLTLSARSDNALRTTAQRYAARLRAEPDLDVVDVCRTTATGRNHFTHRAAFVVDDREDALALLDAVGRGEPGRRAHTGVVDRADRGNVAFLFPGQGAQYPDMGRRLYDRSPVFRDAVDECAEAVASLLPVPLTSLLFPGAGERHLLEQTAYAQPALFAVEYALARWWMHAGVHPDLLLGHSVGQLAAACVAGVFEPADGARLAVARGRAVQDHAPPGAMLVAFADEATVRGIIDGHPDGDRLAVAAVNTDATTTVSGPPEGIAALRAALRARRVTAHDLPARHAFHGPTMSAAREAFAVAARALTYRAPRIPLVSDLDGTVFEAGAVPGADYWERHLEHTVRFVDGLRTLAARGCTRYVETGPGQVLSGAGRRVVAPAVWASSLLTGQDDDRVLADAVARLYVAGQEIGWTVLHTDGPGRRVALPTYPFERSRHWLPVPVPHPVRSAPESIPVELGGSTPVPSTSADDQIVTVLGDTLAALLGSPTAPDADASFLDLGADSMTLFQLLQTVQRTYGVSVPIGRLFEEIDTIGRLAAHIGAEAPAAVAVAAPVAGGQASAPVAEGQAGAPVAEVQAGAPVIPGPAATGAPVAAAPGSAPADAGAVARFLEIHATVMGQAYELLRGGVGQPVFAPPGLPAPAVAPQPQPQPPAQAQAQHRPAVEAAPTAGTVPLAPRDAYVAFQPAVPRRSGPMTEAQKAFTADLVDRYRRRTKGSLEQAVRERAYHADVRHAPQPYLNLKQIRYPLVVSRSSGSRLWDVDGNEYVDLTMGFGVNLFGHNEPFIQAAVGEQLARGIQLGPHSPLTADVAGLIRELTGVERTLFCNTGSEAVMVAVRLARAVTGRTRIAVFAGAYHGSADPILARQDAASGHSVPLAPGVPEEISRNVVVLPYGDEASLATIRELAGELAAVLVEPVQSRRPDIQPVEFLRRLRALTSEVDVPLVFDEVITGFRCHLGGAQALFGIRADLTTYGKVVGGGMPIGVVAGDARFLDAVDGGAWMFTDGPYPSSVRTFYTGTFCKHPLSLAAAHAVLKELKRRGPQLQEQLNQRVEDMARRVDARFAELGVAISVARFGSLFRLRFLEEPPSSEAAEIFHTLLVEKGVYIWEGRNCFLSTAHTDADVEHVIGAISTTTEEMLAAGFFRRAGEEPAAGADPYPLTEAQREIWFLAQLGPEQSRAYNEGLTLDLTGPLDTATLTAAVDEVVGRHESLRTVFAPDGSHQRVLPRSRTDVPLIDCTDPAAGPAEEQARSWCDARAAEVFDLAAGPLVKAALLRLGPEHHRLHLSVHHTVVDGWSFAVLVDEILRWYEARRAGARPELPAPARYRDHVRRQEQRTAGPAGQADTAYWREQFRSPAPPLRLPTDRPASGPRDGRGGQVRLELDADAVDRISRGARALSVTPFTLLLAAISGLLHRITGQDDLVVGVPVARRDDGDDDRLVGNCSVVLPVRSRLAPGRTGREHLAATRRALGEAYSHPGFSIAAVRDRLPAGHAEIYRCLFNLDRPATVPQLPGLGVAARPAARHHAKAPLEVDVVAVDGRMTVTMGYAADLFDESTIRRHAEAYLDLVQRLLERPDEPVSAPAAVVGGGPEAATRSGGHGAAGRWPWNDTARAVPDATLHDLVAAQAGRTPQAVALVEEGGTVTYADLDRRADRLARHLRTLGVGPERLVALALPRSVELVVAVLAVLKAGGGFLPLDLDSPPARIAQVLEDAEPALLLADSTTARAVPRAGGLTSVLLDDPATVAALRRRPARASAPAPVDPGHVAYVLYTSGSTGRPKGVVITHRAVLNTLLWWADEAAYGPGDRVLLKTPLTFDPSMLELFSPLFSGATVVLARPDGHRDSGYLTSVIQEQGVSCVQFVPTTLREFLDEPGVEKCTSLRQVMCAGEALPAALVDRCLDLLDVELVNLYGPTEASIDLTWWRCRRPVATASAPIGLPLWNFRVYVLDDDLRPVPPGTTGELYVAGVGLARGYLGRPDVTALAFLPNPFDGAGERMYRTGDLVRQAADGTLEFLGRRDGQLKVNGVRVELGDVEAALRRLPGVREAAVLVRPAGDAQQLVGFVAGPADAAAGQPAALLAALREMLPAAMMPAHLVSLPELPRLTSGKVDRRALADQAVPAGPAADYVAPRTVVEERLLAIWTDVLGRPGGGVTDDFFASGGTSLTAMRLISRVRSELGKELPIRQLFATPTVAGLAGALADRTTRPPLVAGERPEAVPLSYTQQRLWFLHRLSGPGATYNIPVSLRLSGALDTGTLRAAFRDVIARHESLRTVFVDVDGTPVQRIVPVDAVPDVLTYAAVGAGEVAELVRTAADHPFDLATEPPVRAWLYDLGGDEHVLTVVVHHIAGDGWSMVRLVRDLADAYVARRDGTGDGLPALPVQYADYVLWQTRFLGRLEDPDSVAGRQLAFWRQALAGAPEELPLPFDRPRPRVASGRGASVEFEVPADVHRGLLDLARHSRTSVFMVAQAALAVALARLGAGTDIPLGTPVNGRADEALGELVGCFVNTVVLRTDVSGNPTFRELLGRVRDTNLAAYANQDVPFEFLVRALNPARSRSRHPLFQVMFVSENTEELDLTLPGLRLREEPLGSTTAKFDMVVSIRQRLDGADGCGGVAGSLEYATDLFDAGTARTVADRFVAVLTAVAADPATRVGVPTAVAALGAGDLAQTLTGAAAGVNGHG